MHPLSDKGEKGGGGLNLQTNLQKGGGGGLDSTSTFREGLGTVNK